MRTGARWAACVAAALAWPAAARGGELACPLLAGGERPVLILAQRAIERSWGPSEDSVWVEQEVPGWRSEALALGFSAVVPGLGQAYAGETRRGLWFALAEVAGWAVHLVARNRGDEFRTEAARFAGSPHDTTSRWSLARWEAATDGDAAELAQLYAADPEAFYDRITEPGYAAGWSGDAESARQHFRSMREESDERLRTARWAGAALWLNHLAAAADALRAARVHNVPLAPGTRIEIRTGWRGGAAMSAALVGRF